jgi:TRAP-type mannitol/chloroaromatic compound transport system permease small subunit
VAHLLVRPKGQAMPKDPFSRTLARIVDVMVIAAGWWLLALSVLSCIEMVTRKLFAFSLQGIDEVGGYTLAIVGAIGFSYTLISRGHTRIDFLLGKLSATPKAWLNALAMVSLAAMAVFSLARGWVVLAESIEFESRATTPLQTPMWLPQGMWFVAWALFALLCVVLAAHCAWLLVRGRVSEVNATYGPQTLEEEIEAEAGDVLEATRVAALAGARS